MQGLEKNDDEKRKVNTTKTALTLMFDMNIPPKAPLNTKLTIMDCGIGNTNLHGSSSSGLGYDCFCMKSTDGATMYFNLGSGIGSGKFQADYRVKLREKDER